MVVDGVGKAVRVAADLAAGVMLLAPVSDGSDVAPVSDGSDVAAGVGARRALCVVDHLPAGVYPLEEALSVLGEWITVTVTVSNEECAGSGAEWVQIGEKRDGGARWAGWWVEPNEIGKALIFLNSAHDMSRRQWESMIVHEFGHHLGLDHSVDRESIMFERGPRLPLTVGDRVLLDAALSGG